MHTHKRRKNCAATESWTENAASTNVGDEGERRRKWASSVDGVVARRKGETERGTEWGGDDDHDDEDDLACATWPALGAAVTWRSRRKSSTMRLYSREFSSCGTCPQLVIITTSDLFPRCLRQHDTTHTPTTALLEHVPRWNHIRLSGIDVEEVCAS